VAEWLLANLFFCCLLFGVFCLRFVFCVADAATKISRLFCVCFCDASQKKTQKTEKEGEAVATCLRLLFKRQIMKTRRWLLTTTTGDDSFVIVQLTPGKIQINCHQNGANNAAEIKSHR